MTDPYGDYKPKSYSYIRPIALGCALVVALLFASASCYAGSITGVSEIYAEQTQTITITGSGFGTLSSYFGNSDYIALVDLTAAPPWEAGYAPDGNAVTLDIVSWTDDSIVLGGFGSAYGDYNWTLTDGDLEQVQIWNAQSGDWVDSFNVIVGASPVPEPSSLLLLGSGLVSFAGIMRRKLKA